MWSKRIVTMLSAGVIAAAAAGLALAQSGGGRGGHIERVKDQRIGGEVIARVAGLTWDECADRCLADQRCVAIEHFRSEGRIVSRRDLCRLFRSTGERRASRYADIGFRRPGPGPAKRDQKVATEETKGRVPEVDARTRAPSASAPASESTSGARPQVPPTAEAPRAAPPPPVAAAPVPPATAAPPMAPAPSASAPVAAAPPPPPIAKSEPPRTRGLTPSPPPAAAARPSAPPAATTAPPPVGAAPTATPEWDLVPVWYGTDRARTDQPKRIAYGSERARRMELGHALVTVPKIHQVPNIERPWAIKVPWLDITIYQEAEDPRRHFTVQEIKALTREQAIQLVRQRLGASREYKDQALVFVHGYNNGFDDALYRTAQIAYDLKFDGAPFMYSWPSRAGTLSYPYDRDSAQQAEQYLSEFLQLVLNETGAKSVSIIAHSMGNQPLLQVLRELNRTAPAGAPRLHQVILAAPDVDRHTFEFLSSQIRGVSANITLYASAYDRALIVSRQFAGGIPRAGDVPAELGPTVIQGIDTIDVSALSTDYLGLNHSAYAERTALLADIEQLLKTGVRPPERRLPVLVRVPSEKGDFWRYPQ
jgi:esterase/lipase superfamily enzyme